MKIILLILVTFIMVGTLLPYINESFGGGEYDTQQNINTTAMIDGVLDKDGESVKTTQILKSIGLMFFWTFGALPFFIDLFFIILRTLLVLVIYRQIRSGAG